MKPARANPLSMRATPKATPKKAAAKVRPAGKGKAKAKAKPRANKKRPAPAEANNAE